MVSPDETAESAHQSRLDSVDREILNTFNSGINYASQKDRNKVCVPGTGDWFFHSPQYEETQNARGSHLLFVTAEAGGGKSTVMKTLVDRILERKGNALVAYFFFKDDVDILRSYEKAFSCLIYKLLVHEKSLLKHIKEVYQKYGNGLKHDTKAMLEVLSVLSNKAQKDIYCILDALDECEAAGRNQLLADLKAFFSNTGNLDTRLKFVVSSRPYQDENHQYTALLKTSSQRIRHVVGENARVQSEIFQVIQFRAEILARERELDEATQAMLVKMLFAQNRLTRSFLAVQMAFELLDSHHRMHKGAGERTVSTILSEIPQSLGSKFEALLDRSTNREHTWRLFCVILASRKTLKIDEFKVIFAITEPRSSSVSKAQSYEDLELPSDDDEFKRLVRSRCGLFVTFVRNSVHLFHQTAREYLLERLGESPEPALPLLQASSRLGLSNKPSWKGSISLSGANLVCASLCLDILSFEVPKKIPYELFDNLEAGNKIDESFPQDPTEGFGGFIAARPFYSYAACNWHEHVALAGDHGFELFLGDDYNAILDISKPQFWAWSLTLTDCICSGTVKKRPPISNIWSTNGGVREYGSFMRKNCLEKIFPMDDNVRALLDVSGHFTPCEGQVRFLISDSIRTLITDNRKHYDQVTWKALDGYHLIDRFHLANGEYEYTSSSRAVEAFENGDTERASALLARVPHHTLIWTSITAGAPSALRGALGSSKDLSWLQIIPDHILYRRQKTCGWSSRNGKELRESRQRGWIHQWPPSFAVMLRLSMLDRSAPAFKALADWIDQQTEKRLYAQQLWEAGGFIIPTLSPRLVRSGAQIDCELWEERATAFQIACSFWVHEAICSLAQIGADPIKLTPEGYNALHCFFHHRKVSSEDSWGSTVEKEHATYFFNKVRIRKSICAITAHTSTKQTLLSQKCHRGYTPLMLGARSSRSSGTAIKCVLDQGAAPNQRDHKGRTALMHFFLGDDDFVGRDTSILKHLLRASADPLAFDMFENSALSYWAKIVASAKLEYLYPGFNTYNKSFHVIVHFGSLSFENLAAQLRLIELPLVIASRLGNAQMCWALLSAEANPNENSEAYRNFLGHYKREDGEEQLEETQYTVEWNPLLTALQSRAYKTAAMLIERGADLNFTLKRCKRRKYNRSVFLKGGGTPLHLAIAAGEDSWGDTSNRVSLTSSVALKACVFQGGIERHLDNGLEELARFQREHYQDPHGQDEEDSDPECDIRRTVFANDSRGSNLLPYDQMTGISQSFEPPSNPSLATIIQGMPLDQQQESLIRYMLSEGASSNACTVKNVSPLMLSVKKRRVGLVEILLEYGADPNVVEAGGATPLMVAARDNSPAIVERLLVSGADPNAQLDTKDPKKCKCGSFIDWGSWNYGACDAPYSALAVASAWGYKNVVELLLRYGADPNLKITHHAHGKLPSNQDMRRRKGSTCSSDDESEPESEEWKGVISVGTALTWATEEVRDLLMHHGADPGVEEAMRECGCIIEHQPPKRPGFSYSDDDEIEEDQ